MKKILIIEDEQGITSFLEGGLSEEGYDVVVAADGREGLKKYQECHPDLILLDWMLPVMDGIAVCNAIRRNDQQTPILFLTAKDTVQDTVQGLRSGANDYIKKPFSFEELLERIRIHFRHEQEDEIYKFQDITVNNSTRQVWKGDEELAFTAREFDLLFYLLERQGRVCTRDEITRDVWKIKFKYDTGVIDVFMNSLRKKVGADVIRTVRGVGFIIDR